MHLGFHCQVWILTAHCRAQVLNLAVAVNARTDLVTSNRSRERTIVVGHYYQTGTIVDQFQQWRFNRWLTVSGAELVVFPALSTLLAVDV